MDKKKVSIMLTCYNCVEYIDSAIHSVVTQDMPFDWELLIGDDGSIDGTKEHVQNWIEMYPYNIRLYVMDRKYVTSKDGTRAARNRANLLSHATGEYLIFLDGDDCFLNTSKIRTQIKILDNPLFEKCACVAHNILAYNVKEHKKYPLVDEKIKSGIISVKKYWKDLYFHTDTILFRRCCIELMLKEEYRDFLNDNFITYIILQYGCIYYLDEIWAQYNLTGDGLWTGNKKVYGCFRNLILYDLERKINIKLARCSFIRHLYDFRYILANYTINDKDIISPLVDHLPTNDFYYTYLLYNWHNKKNIVDRIHIALFKLKVGWIFHIRRIYRFLVTRYVGLFQ